MFVREIYPRELVEFYSWDNFYFKINDLGPNSIEIEEVTKKPEHTRAIDVITKLKNFVANSHGNHLNKCQISLKSLNSSPQNANLTYTSLDQANQLITFIAFRVVLGYERVYLNLTIKNRVKIFKRIQDAIYLFFGWETERDNIHKLDRNIFHILDDASQRLVPDSKIARKSDADYFRSLLKDPKFQT